MAPLPHIDSADSADLEFCCGVDPRIPRHLVMRKISDGDVVVGRLRLDWLGCKAPFLASLEVVSNRRRHGVVSALLHELERRLVGRGYDRLIGSTLPDDLLSQKWHGKQGIGKCGFLAGINNDGVGEIFYTKELVQS